MSVGSVNAVSVDFSVGVEGLNGGAFLHSKNVQDNLAIRLGRLEGQGQGDITLVLGSPKIGMEAIVVPFVVDGKKNVSALKPVDPQEGDDQFVWERKISIFHAAPSRFVTTDEQVRGIYYTRYPDNLLKVARIGLGGKIEIWEIAVISQEGDFFLTVQRLYEAQALKSEKGSIKIPEFDQKWPQLAQLIRQVTTTMGLSLEAESTAHQTVEENLAGDLSENEGRVVWYNAANGVGAIVLGDGSQARVYWKEISQRDLGRRYLVKGEKVRYATLKTPDVSPTKRQTGFQKEAIGVTLIKS